MISLFYFRFRLLLPDALGGSGGGEKILLSDACCLRRSLLPLLIVVVVSAVAGDLTLSIVLLGATSALPSTLTIGDVLLLLLLLTLPPPLEVALDALLLVFNFMVGFTAAQISQVEAMELFRNVHASQDQPS